jgi:tetratricopeptide (TPR) repeat protein
VDLTHKNLKNLYSRTKNYFAEAIKKDPQNPKLFYNRGLFYKDAGKVQKALADFQKVLELDHNFKDAQEQIRILQEKPVEKN